MPFPGLEGLFAAGIFFMLATGLGVVGGFYLHVRKENQERKWYQKPLDGMSIKEVTEYALHYSYDVRRFLQIQRNPQSVPEETYKKYESDALCSVYDLCDKAGITDMKDKREVIRRCGLRLNRRSILIPIRSTNVSLS